MKKINTIIFFFLFASVLFGQLAQNSWSVGLGGGYPRFISININPLNSNYGGFLSFQRNFSEHTALRLKAGYSHIESEFANPSLMNIKVSTNVYSGDLDFIFYPVPCEPVSPYISAGVGAFYKMLTNKASVYLKDNTFNYQLNAGAGIEWNLDSDWKLISEFTYHITNDSEIDGSIGAGEVNNRDSYGVISLGFLFFIDKGAPSKYCQLYSGISQEQKDLADYNRIEEIIKKNIPREVVKQIVVEKPASKLAKEEKWILIGVNFDFGSSKFSPESYPILFDAAKTLMENEEMQIEIQGYTDNVGSENYNKKLSQKRADAVRNYLISKGISANRMTSVGYGEADPISDNKTADGRAMNRRIEFKVK